MPLRNVLCLALLGCALSPGQVLMEAPKSGGPLRLLPSDQAIFEEHERRTDLPCTVTPKNPELGYDLSFHTGYEVTIPRRALAGNGNSLTAVIRVTAEGKEDPVYLWQKWTVPPLEEGASGEAVVEGTFVLGEGKYQIAWLMHDRSERFCSAFWRISAAKKRGDRPVELQIAPDTVESSMRDPFRDEAPVERNAKNSLHVLVLLHVAPRVAGSAKLGDSEAQTMASILRRIDGERRFTRFSITAFNIDQRSVVYRQRNAHEIDLPGLGLAVQNLHFGTVSVQRLREKDGETPFLMNMFAEGLANKPDVVMIVGPKGEADDGSRNLIKQLKQPGCPVFYLNFGTSRESSPWRDLLGSVVKVWKGIEYTITSPRELFTAWSGVMSHLSGDPAGRIMVANGSQ